jgi:Skp family chaperone for outer membrane proteins
MSTFNRSIPFLALLCAASGRRPASAEIKIGVVNFQKLLEEAPQTKTAMQALENEFAPRRRELLTMQNDLKARDEKLQKEGAVMAEADRAKAEKTLRDEQREFSRKAGEFQDDASTRRNEELGKVQRYLVAEIQTYAARRVSIWCWATACSTPSRRSTSPRTCWRAEDQAGHAAGGGAGAGARLPSRPGNQIAPR